MLAGLGYGSMIEGSKYKLLIDWCFTYSTCFSLLGCNLDENDEERMQVLNQLSPNLILKRETTYYQPGYDDCFMEYMHCSHGMAPTLYLYRCCEETKKFLLKENNSIYWWKNNKPEDLCFYRKDRTALLYTTAHEGICWISCTSNEFKYLPNKKLWKISDETSLDDEWYF